MPGASAATMDMLATMNRSLATQPLAQPQPQGQTQPRPQAGSSSSTSAVGAAGPSRASSGSHPTLLTGYDNTLGEQGGIVGYSGGYRYPYTNGNGNANMGGQVDGYGNEPGMVGAGGPGYTYPAQVSLPLRLSSARPSWQTDHPISIHLTLIPLSLRPAD